MWQSGFVRLVVMNLFYAGQALAVLVNAATAANLKTLNGLVSRCLKSVPQLRELPEMMVEPFVPLSVLSLDIDEPTNGWAASLAARGIKVHLDDLGRLSISRDDARRLFTERREAAEKAREMAEANEQQAIEADRQWRAALPKGAAWYDVPAGVHPAAAMLQQAKDAEPRRTPSQVEWLFGEADTMVYHELPAEDAS